MVSGLSWKDHEYMTSALAPEDVGWDWFGLQFYNGTALMLFQIRQADGSVTRFSSGTFVAGDGGVILSSRPISASRRLIVGPVTRVAPPIRLHGKSKLNG